MTLSKRPGRSASLDAVSTALDEGDLLVLLGPQVDLDGGHPDLDGLAYAMVERARGVEPGALPAAEIERLVAAGRQGEVFGRVQFILGREAFQRGVTDLLSTHVRVPPVLHALARLRDRLRAIYTGSLVGGMFSRAFGGRWPTFDEASPRLAQRKGLFFHMRGTLGRPDSWVLDDECARRELSPASARGELLGTVYNAHHMLLLGFGAEDSELQTILEMLPAVDADQVPEHFIALSEPCSPDARRRLASRGFEVVERSSEALVAEFVGDDDDEAATPSGRCPYPGLVAFTEADASLFFGRHVEVSRAATELGDDGRGEYRRWLSVEGPSGVGKSSFVSAGVVPALREGFAAGAPGRWTVAHLRPGTHPVRALFEAVLGALGLGVETRLDALVAQAEGDADTLRQLVADHAPASHGVLVVVDQLEELVTLAEESEREGFGEQLMAALEAEPFHLVTTVRSEFVATLRERLPEFGARLDERAVRYALPTICRVGLREAITEPAAREGVRIEPELVEAMLAEVERGDEVDEAGEARTATATLPLIAYVLRLLWDSAGSESGLTLEAYRALGGIRGALGRSADQALSELGPEATERVEALLLGLARVDRNGEITRRPLLVEDARALAGADALGERVLARLLEEPGQEQEQTQAYARLLAMRQESGEQLVEVVHEALLRGWARCRALLEANREQMLADDELERRARRWVERGRPFRGLPDGVELRELLAGRSHGLTAPVQREFQRALRRARRLRQVALGVRGMWNASTLAVIAVLMAGGWGAAEVKHNATNENHAKEKEKLEDEFDQEKKELDREKKELDREKKRLEDENMRVTLANMDFKLREELLARLEPVLDSREPAEVFVEDVIWVGSKGHSDANPGHISYHIPWGIARAAAAMIQRQCPRKGGCEDDERPPMFEAKREWLLGTYETAIDSIYQHRLSEDDLASGTSKACQFLQHAEKERERCFPDIGVEGVLRSRAPEACKIERYGDQAPGVSPRVFCESSKKEDGDDPLQIVSLPVRLVE